MDRKFIATKIRQLRFDLKQRTDAFPSLKKDIYFADHLATRMVERKLEKDAPFVIAVAAYFMENYFYENTYTNRKYIMQFKGLKVGIMIKMGAMTEKRYAIVSTAFTSDQTYECDELVTIK
jgi:hypothetical protein